MSGAVIKLGLTLKRVIVLRQVNAKAWRVEGYEQQAGRWRFTWLLAPADSEARAARHARVLAQEMGIPVAEQSLGERMRLVDGVLGRAA